jgi:hypothetical protein
MARIRIQDEPLLIGDRRPRASFERPTCGYRASDGIAIVLLPLIWTGDQVADPAVLKDLSAALLEAAVWLEEV